MNRFSSLAVMVTLLCAIPVSGVAAKPNSGRRATSFAVRRSGSPVTTTFSATEPGEAVLTLALAAPGVDWATTGSESATVRVKIDGRPATDIVVPSATPLRRSLALGRVAGGDHHLGFSFDEPASSVSATAVNVSDVIVQISGARDPAFLALRHAPILVGRSIPVANKEGAGTSYSGPLQNAVTDTPLLAWHEVSSGSIPTNRVLEYSVVWSNEDGGTNSAALMARWGRTTDIEWIYRVEVDQLGDAIPGTAVFQGANHIAQPFNGTKENDHPLLQTCTANNNVCDTVVDAGMRFFLGAGATRAAGRAREVTMDANPWSYRVMADEMLREGRIESPSDAASPAVGDQRTYLYVEVRKSTFPENAGIGPWTGLALEVQLADGRRFLSNHGVADWAIQRDLPAATTIELPAGTTESDVTSINGLRVVSGGLDYGVNAINVTDINRAFFLDSSFVPQPSFVTWAGNVMLTRGSPAAVLWHR